MKIDNKDILEFNKRFEQYIECREKQYGIAKFVYGECEYHGMALCDESFYIDLYQNQLNCTDEQLEKYERKYKNIEKYLITIGDFKDSYDLNIYLKKRKNISNIYKNGNNIMRDTIKLLDKNSTHMY